MRYFAGVDGGGTKTFSVIGDEKGNILAWGSSSASNHQVVGPETAGKAIGSSLQQAAKALGLSLQEIEYTVFGLAGADLEPDFAILNRICGDILQNGRFRVMNDSWIGLRAAIPENWGIVSVCGSGSSCSGRNRDGREATLRNLSYETGNYGGGFTILQEAFHHAFRSEEGTGPKTGLETELLRIFGRKDYSELVEPVSRMELDPAAAYQVPPAVGRLANSGDDVCQNILVKMGGTLGEIASGVIRKLGMERETFKISLVGGVFKSECPLLLDEYTTSVHRIAPFAKMVVCSEEPALGAYYLAIESSDHASVLLPHL